MLARVIYEDAVNQQKAGLSGMVADGSQRAFFPNGFCFYVYGEAQYDPSRSFEGRFVLIRKGKKNYTLARVDR